jgi:hypothetical protein
LHLFLQLRESRGVSGLVLFEELKDLLDTLTAKLLADGVQVVTFVLPEVELFSRIGVHSRLKSVFRILLEDVFNLSTPLYDSV